jgi:hypothetical protein
MIIADNLNSRARERQLRRLAQRHGLRLEKSRIRTPQARGYGGYSLFDVQHNAIVYGGVPLSIVPCWTRSNAFYSNYRLYRRPNNADEAGNSHDGW